MSRNTSEDTAKAVSGLSYIALHTLALIGAYGLLPKLPAQFELPNDLGVAEQWAVLVPLFSLGIFVILHRIDAQRKTPPKAGEPDHRIWGLASRALVSGANPGDYASSSISHLAIHSAVAVWVIGTVGRLGTLGLLTAVILGLAVMLEMVSVLCYAQSSRWSMPSLEDPATETKLWTKRELLKKATRFDQLSWYALTTGLIWAIALANPILSILASFFYGLLLWIYYFRWDSEQPPKIVSQPQQIDKLRSALESYKAAQAEMTAELEIWVAKAKETELVNDQQKAAPAKDSSPATPPLVR